VRVEPQLVQLIAVARGNEPEVGPGRGLLLEGHGTRNQMAVRPPGGHHRDLDILDHRPQLLDAVVLASVGHWFSSSPRTEVQEARFVRNVFRPVVERIVLLGRVESNTRTR
jgi:hypothetical protein